MSDKSRVVVDLNVDPNTDKADKTEHLVELELGGELIWKNHSTHCPHFEIIFEGSSPAKPSDKLTGTLEQPVSIRMPEERAEFFYKVHFKKKDGTRCRDDTHRSIRICPGGQHC
jgi:hypothetical protein